MHSSTDIIAGLAVGPALVTALIGELEETDRTWRAHPGKWSAHEHAAHLARIEPSWAERVNQILTQDRPTIRNYDPDADDRADPLLGDDLVAALRKYAEGRERLCDRLRSLPEAAWDRPATHPVHGRYSLRLMCRHAVLHDHLHAYRIEEILLRPR